MHENNDNDGTDVKTVVMNIDVLIHIFSYLEINELMRLERVSKQFKICANYWFGRQRNIAINSRVGVNQYLPKGEVIPKAYAFPNRILACHSDGTPCLMASKETMLWLSRKFPNIKYLAISHFIQPYFTP